MLNLIAVLFFASACLGIMGWIQYNQVRHGGHDHEQVPTSLPRKTFLDQWEQAAMQAGLGWRRTVYYIAAGSGVGLGTILLLAGHINAALLLMAGSLAGPYWYVKHMQAVRSAMFSRQLPQALLLAASVLRAGGTLLQAVDAIATEMPNPMGGEFQRIQQQMRLQVPAHEAMAEAQRRIGVREFAAVVVASRITTEVGGNLAHVFDQVGRSIVEAQNTRRTIRAFTTEGRMSTNMIAALPFVVLGFMQFLCPGYFEPLFTTWPGRIILVVCLGAILLGWATIRRMVDIQVD